MLNTLIAILAAAVSSFVMLLIALITPLGPWIEPIVLLLGLALMRLLKTPVSFKNKERLVASAVSSGIAGIAAVGCAFTLPTLFFLEKERYFEYTAGFVVLASSIAILVLIAGSLAFVLNELWEKYFISSKAPFPAVELMNELILSQSDATVSAKISHKICLGGLVALAWQALLFLFGGICRFSSVFAMWPLLASLGFMGGAGLVAPLLIGLLAKTFLFKYVYVVFFSAIKQESFFAALCSGIIFSGIVLYVFNLKSNKLFYCKIGDSAKKVICSIRLAKTKTEIVFVLVGLLAFVGLAVLLASLSFSIMSILYLICAVVICAYQLVLIASQTGLAPLGRFATFVMIPGIALFKYNPLQITIVVALVELIGGITVNVMFGRKLAQVVGVSKKFVVRSQITGLVVSACILGIASAFLGGKITLGVEPFLAQRALARTMLIGISSFNAQAVIMGFLFGIMLHRFKVNSVLVISGFLMQPLVVFPLLIGGLLNKYIDQEKNYYSISAGIFAISSLLLLFQIILC